MEVRRHNSEDEIDHGPVLRSLRAAQAKEQQAEEEAKKLKKAKKKNDDDIKQVSNLLDEADGSVSDSSKEKEDGKRFYEGDDAPDDGEQQKATEATKS